MDNLALFYLIHGLAGQNLTLDSLMIFGAKYIIYLTVILFFILGFRGGIKEKKSLILILFALPISVLITKIIHIFVIEPRPFVTYHFIPLVNQIADASFPSRHASIMSVIAFAFTFDKSIWSSLFLLLMTWVGLSRIYTGVHYPVDILGGFGVGIISLVIAKKFLKLIHIRFFNQSSKS